jgi:hypothetical protein
LPLEAQAAPVYGMLAEDVDNDGNLDLLLVGNDYGMEPGGGRHDAFIGLTMKGDGKGKFSSLPVTQSGFFVHGDAKGLATIHTAKGDDLFIATQNQDSVKVFLRKANNSENKNKWITVQPHDFCADIVFNDNKKRRIEFNYGSTFLSQSSRRLRISKDAVKVIFTDFKGNKREVAIDKP